MTMILCIDIGGTFIKYAGYDSEGKQLTKEEKLPTGVTEHENHILSGVKEIVASKQSEFNLTGIAISSAGIIDSTTGEVVYSGYTIPHYTGAQIKAEIEDQFQLPCTVINDVNAALLGEYWLGAGVGYDTLVCLTIGTGVGGAVMIDGELVEGKNSTAGELGYMLVNGEDRLQDIASTRSLVERVRNRTNDESISSYDIIRRAKAGDHLYVEEIDKMVSAIGQAIININYLISPECIILGGGIMDEFDFFSEKLNFYISKHTIDPLFNSSQLVAAKNGNNAGMLGALYHFNTQSSAK